MSFILDALKKSEDERQRTVGPSLADAPLRRVRVERPWWAVAVAALLVINLGVLLVVLMRDEPDATPATVATPAVAPQPASSLPPPRAAPAETASQPAMMPAQPVPPAPGVYRQPVNPSVRSLAEEAGTLPPANGTDDFDRQMNPALAAAAAVPAGPAMVRPIQPPNVTPLPGGATFPSVATNRAPDPRADEVLPTAVDLAAGGTSLPELKLDIHVYSKNPAERFVFVNMRKYLEGQTLQEGPVLEKITNDGAVLNQHGLRFALPRQ